MPTLLKSVPNKEPIYMTANKINHIDVSVSVSFLANASNIENNDYRYSYHITIKNIGAQSAQLMSRHWIITEADDEVREVKGPGVVGDQPFIAPNETYQYTSSTYFKMPTGSMQGTYHMIAEDGTEFEAQIPIFVCNMPRVLH